MEQEDKDLLLKDLCARLPYGVICHTEEGDGYLCSINQTIFGTEYGLNINPLKRDYFNDSETDEQAVKPYLRPMSSMTEEEKDELCRLCDFEKSYDDRDYFTHYGIEVISEYCVNGEKIVESTINYNVIDFFYAHHLDWRGLIPIGLALEAPKDMYKTE